jgi:hypothetical protein
MKMEGVSEDSNQHIIRKNFLKATHETTPTTGCNETLRIEN